MSSSLSSSTKTAFAISGIVVSTAGVLFNASGIYALVKTKPHGNKQTYLLINISVISLCMCLLFLPNWALGSLVSVDNKKVIEEYLFIAETACYMALVTSAIVLSIDRLLAVVLPFRHRAIVTSRFILVSISMCWFIGLSTRVPFLLMSYPEKLLHMVYLDVSINAVNIIFQPITYTFILFKWRQRHTIVNSKRSQAAAKAVSVRTRDSKREAIMHKIALLVAGSCIFSGICDIIYVSIGLTTPSSKETLLSPIAFLMWNIIPMIQSLFYILTKPEIRKLFVRMLYLTSEDE